MVKSLTRRALSDFARLPIPSLRKGSRGKKIAGAVASAATKRKTVYAPTKTISIGPSQNMKKPASGLRVSKATTFAFPREQPGYVTAGLLGGTAGNRVASKTVNRVASKTVGELPARKIKAMKTKSQVAIRAKAKPKAVTRAKAPARVAARVAAPPRIRMTPHERREMEITPRPGRKTQFWGSMFGGGKRK